MINPMNLIKVDDVRDEEGKTFHIGPLSDYDTEEYDLTNPKDFERFIKDVKSEVRGSFEYRELIRYLREYGGMDRSGLNPNISNSDGSKVKIEIHHTPFVLEDIVKIVYEKRRFYHEDISVQMIAKEVMECHYKCLVGLYPLTATEHELVHNGYLFIPPSNVFGNYKRFMETYSSFIEDEDKETIEEIEGYEQSFDPNEQNKLLAQSNIYLDPAGAYALPDLNKLSDVMQNRIETVKNNMYSLPVLNEQQVEQKKMIEAIYFVDENGERIE
jgi:hypothetical protein